VVGDDGIDDFVAVEPSRVDSSSHNVDEEEADLNVATVWLAVVCNIGATASPCDGMRWCSQRKKKRKWKVATGEGKKRRALGFPGPRAWIKKGGVWWRGGGGVVR
jgi:hypothetical protein